MEVILAGMNLDMGTIEEARELLHVLDALGTVGLKSHDEVERFLERTVWSPETLSAAYARISRDPAPVPELRERARREVREARRSNEKIIFDLGHGSVAEHAVFNFDVLGVSRLAMEAIEHHRLCSFTEKSQRYITLGQGVVVPEEIEGCGLADRFREAAAANFRDYEYLLGRLLEHARSASPELAGEKSGRRLLEGAAREDARYALLLATPGQLGMTANARNVELMIGRLAAHRLAEMRGVGAELARVVRGVAPSLIKHTEGAGNLREAIEGVRELAGGSRDGDGEPGEEVRLVSCPADGDERVATALLASAGGGSAERCRRTVDSMSGGEMAELFKAALRPLRQWDRPPRAFETVSVTAELQISASCFAQLKRHRMATIIAGDYAPELGVTRPPAIGQAGLDGRFGEAVERAQELYEQLLRAAPEAAAYALTNAHRRRVLFTCNLRELYHLARLRLDEHAQWDIRAATRRLVELVRERMPLAMTMACGKHEFEDVHRRGAEPAHPQPRHGGRAATAANGGLV